MISITYGEPAKTLPRGTMISHAARTYMKGAWRHVILGLPSHYLSCILIYESKYSKVNGDNIQLRFSIII